MERKREVMLARNRKIKLINLTTRLPGQHEHTLSGQHDHPLSVDPLSATKQIEIVGSCSLEIGWSTGHPSNKPSGATGPGSLKAIWQKLSGRFADRCSVNAHQTRRGLVIFVGG